MTNMVDELFPRRKQYTPYEQVLFLGSLAKDETVPDSVVTSVFLATEVETGDELLIAVSFLENLRPGVVETLSALLAVSD